MNYLVFDFETTVKCPIGNNKAHPSWPGNWAVVLCHTHNGITYVRRDNHQNVGWTDLLADNFKDAHCLVGHNLAFDLRWLRRMSGNRVNLQNKTLWDTAIAEYVLTGQQSKWPSLDELCTKYGLPLKDKTIQDMWDAGVQTENMGSALEVYCKGDVNNTEKIFLHQLREAKEKGCLKLILVLNDALLATTEMQHNGMKVYRKRLQDILSAAELELGELEIDFITELGAVVGDLPYINLGSPKQLSTIFYGGGIDHVVKEVNGVYKTGVKAGQPKEVKKIVTTTYPALVDPVKLGIPATAHGYSTDDAAIQKIIDATLNPLAYILRDHRELDKQINTYYEKTLSLLFPEDFIYHNINNTATSTGRYSSSEPNLQNITAGSEEKPSKIKECYVSRWGAEGHIVEIDFKQIEMVALAQLSQDPQLIKDLNDGVDIHSTLYKSVHGRVPTKDQRKQFKRASFALIYGAGIKKIAQAAGISLEDAKRFMRAWYVRYPHVVVWWDSVLKEVRKNRKPSPKHHAETGKPLGISEYQLPTGRILTFTETVRPWDGVVDFSPNETKNYPVQSFATGDLVPLFLGKFIREWMKNKLYNKGLLINTVHDSALADVHKDALEEFLNVLKNISNNMSYYIKQEFDIDMKVRLETSITVGPNWSEQNEI